MDLPDDEALTREQFNAEVRRLGPETLAQPHVRAVRSDEVDEDGTMPESEECRAATNALGRGLTMFLGPREEKGKSQRPEGNAMNVVLKPWPFKCIRRSNEAGYDEVYFSWGFGDDGSKMTRHRTGEFGKVSSGDRRNFPHFPNLQSGRFSKCIAGTIMCWEADHSGSEWRSKLRSAMDELARLAQDLSIEVGNDALNELIGLILGFGEYSDLTFWIENIATLIRGLLEWLRNDDDKVKELNYGCSIERLADWINRFKGSSIGGAPIKMNFDGVSQGHHEVMVLATEV